MAVDQRSLLFEQTARTYSTALAAGKQYGGGSLKLER